MQLNKNINNNIITIGNNHFFKVVNIANKNMTIYHEMLDIGKKIDTVKFNTQNETVVCYFQNTEKSNESAILYGEKRIVVIYRSRNKTIFNNTDTINNNIIYTLDKLIVTESFIQLMKWQPESFGVLLLNHGLPKIFSQGFCKKILEFERKFLEDYEQSKPNTLTAQGEIKGDMTIEEIGTIQVSIKYRLELLGQTIVSELQIISMIGDTQDKNFQTQKMSKQRKKVIKRIAQ